ncbi:MAG: ABC transporter permease subunit [Clostridiales bacterium]|nr:ABC transporter permease subunit [Clostridiales bacterium]
MTIVKHELRQGRMSFAVWTGAIAFLLMVCVFLFPEMKNEMDAVGNVFASMGSFTAAFGMDRLNFGTLTGFYAIECGNIVGLGGAFFASLIGAAALSGEEKNRTAELLLTHPVSRARVITEKLIAVMVQIIVMNAVILAIALASIAASGEEIPWKDILLMHLAYFLLQAELAGVCFGISAFLRRGGTGIGLGLAAMMYFLNIIANMTESVKFLKYITPFGYCEGADIVSDGKLDLVLVLLGIGYAAVAVAAGYRHYTGKDIR